MNTSTLPSGLQLQSLITADGLLQLSLADVPTPPPAADEVVVRVEATPINPSDIGLLFGAADMSTARASGSAARPVVTADVPERARKAMAARVGEAMPVGNEGAGVVIATGDAPAARALMGKTVGLLGGAMYSQYRTVKADQCLELPAGTTPAEGASCFVNPLTSLGMVETMRREGHKALVHTAAASNLGQMLAKVCAKDGIPLVNIVRSEEQRALLQSQGAQYVCVTTSPTFLEDLTAAIAATGATLAFDATGGGKLAGLILTAMEAAINRTSKEYSRYGSNTHKQVYLYGSLDTGPTEFNRNFGMTWGMGGWLLFPFLMKISAQERQALRQRVVDELKTTFASHYTKEISLEEALQLGEIAVYGRRATGTKYLINPNKAAAKGSAQ
ncbi:zinc-binding dehydrogenase [Caenimonas sp. SL110]|uniref:zinc-binding dehydrogenase n=1 Tax=Caenimonas sp. SL110 TaxID=1450524 RepID=UPI00065371E2|nr:zinc-binding dehydrogenase [Caenimonas sp. SL110]